MTVATGIAAEVRALGIVLSAVENLTDEQRQFVLRTAVERFGVSMTNVAPKAPLDSAAKLAHAPSADGSSLSPKQFMGAKRPANDVQRIACLAYFLTHCREQPHFKTVDLTSLNLESASPKIGNPAQAVANATKISGYLAPAGGGKKQLTVLGEHVVAALPDQQAVKTVMQDHATNRPKRARKQT